MEDFVKTCDPYQRAADKPSECRNVHTIIARHPWEVVTIDFIYGFASAKGTKHTSVVVITRQVFTTDLPPFMLPLNPSAQDTVQYILEMVAARHRLPCLIISD